jgi:hypothetical protein
VIALDIDGETDPAQLGHVPAPVGQDGNLPTEGADLG